ncbi:outer dense fiber protein 2-like [Salvelinus sp. IW2-2015]|uniref:outer dense fiber protein 2-like n=1 Tax=Salvelinus sp. IW2-2015 TaxID=2691554 RepID=UPI000CDFA44D|nr:outer dense fiber protein 2-like [Salvelinus alpinus]
MAGGIVMLEGHENTENAVHATKSVETTRAHLQGQLHSKEADNNRLTVQLRGLERQLTEQKLEIDGLRGEISSVSEKAEQEKEGLKKATRAQKQRAERFEAAVDKCYTQLREKVCMGNVGSQFGGHHFLFTRVLFRLENMF